MVGQIVCSWERETPPGKPVASGVRNAEVHIFSEGSIKRGEIVDEAVIRLHMEPLDEGGYVATSPDVPGLVAEGRSLVDAVEIAQGLARKIAESCLEHGNPLPPALAGHANARSVDVAVPVGIP